MESIPSSLFKRDMLQSGIARFFDAAAFSDVTVVAPDGRRLKAHQVVLAACSEPFAATLAAGSRPGEELPVTGVDSDALELVIRFFYTGELPLTRSNALALLDAAQRLHVDAAAEAARCYVRGVLSPRTALPLLVEALRHELDDIADECAATAVAIFDDVVAAPEFLAAPFAAVSRLLHAAKASGQHAGRALFASAWRWVTAEPDHVQHLEEVLCLVASPDLEMSDVMGIAGLAPANGAAAPVPAATAAVPAAAPVPAAGRARVLAPAVAPALVKQLLAAKNAAAAAAAAGAVALPLVSAAAAGLPQPAVWPPSGVPAPAAAPPVSPELSLQLQSLTALLQGAMSAGASASPAQQQQLVTLIQALAPRISAIGGAPAAASAALALPLALPHAAAAAAVPVATVPVAAAPVAAVPVTAVPVTAVPVPAAPAAEPSPEAARAAARVAAAAAVPPATVAASASPPPQTMPAPPDSKAAPAAPASESGRSGHRTKSTPRSFSAGAPASTAAAALMPRTQQGGPKGVCRVDGCFVDLTGLREYHQRYRICEFHLKAPSIMREDHPQRFCQQCGRFHALEEFDGNKRSCRQRLQRHNARRRKRDPSGAVGEGAGAGNGAGGRWRVGGSSEDSEDDMGPRRRPFRSSTSDGGKEGGGAWGLDMLLEAANEEAPTEGGADGATAVADAAAAAAAPAAGSIVGLQALLGAAGGGGCVGPAPDTQAGALQTVLLTLISQAQPGSAAAAGVGGADLLLAGANGAYSDPLQHLLKGAAQAFKGAAADGAAGGAAPLGSSSDTKQLLGGPHTSPSSSGASVKA